MELMKTLPQQLSQSNLAILKSFLSPFTEPIRGRRVLLALITASISISDSILNGPEQRPTEKVLGTTSPLIFRHDEDLPRDLRTSGTTDHVNDPFTGNPGPYVISSSVIQNIKRRLDQ